MAGIQDGDYVLSFLEKQNWQQDSIQKAQEIINQKGKFEFFKYFLHECGRTDAWIENHAREGVHQGFTEVEMLEILAKEDNKKFEIYSDIDFFEEFLGAYMNSLPVTEVMGYIKNHPVDMIYKPISSLDLGGIKNNISILDDLLQLYQNLDIVNLVRYFFALTRRYSNCDYYLARSAFGLDQRHQRFFGMIFETFFVYLRMYVFSIVYPLHLKPKYQKEKFRLLENLLDMSKKMGMDWTVGFISVFLAYLYYFLDKNDKKRITSMIQEALKAFRRVGDSLLSEALTYKISKENFEEWIMRLRMVIRSDVEDRSDEFLGRLL